MAVLVIGNGFERVEALAFRERYHYTQSQALIVLGDSNRPIVSHMTPRGRHYCACH
ncbi:MAG: hypothetical protein NVS2B16_08510 [Chloroflexota bacterium]